MCLKVLFCIFKWIILKITGEFSGRGFSLLKIDCMRRIIFLTLVLVLIAGRVFAQQGYVPTFEDTLMVYEGMFSTEEPLHLTLKTDLKILKKTRRDEKYLPAEMTCHVNDSFEVTHPVRIKARGVFRRDNCTYPPFWLNIRYSGIEADSMMDVNKMKMVIRCRKAAQYETYILREYLVYKIYNLVSPYSFRVRLVKLNFVDTGKEDTTTEDWAFLIEPQELLEKRLNAVAVKSDKLSIRTVNREVMDRVSLFQYMIGNGDFSVTGRHNLKIITLKDQQVPGFVPIPYDFDYTGLVNAHYAVPGETLGISSVRERYFLGPCRSKEVELEAIRDFARYRDEMIDYVMAFEYLDEKEKLDMVAYIESYFTESEDQRFYESKISSTCR